ncbi:MAG: bifunctional adenosylcobinamide kinase/adenosylcobinamide-phosphate guanylyltransferase [Eubacteriales bacterium]|nr:bifunctional adenosylcobinamide kinase/adenosylcobinamide-phosphate guanylyltransferase [Eubacteriales bacterium]
MINFISGGCKNGKSTFAEDLAYKISNNKKIYYIATMIPYDKEDFFRIKKHKENRQNKNFITIEEPFFLSNILKKEIDLNATFLIDSITALVLNHYLKKKNEDSLNKIKIILKKDLEYFSKNVRNTIYVSDYIYSDAIQYDNFTEKYKKLLSSIDKYIVKKANNVYEASFGIVKQIKKSD